MAFREVCPRALYRFDTSFKAQLPSKPNHGIRVKLDGPLLFTPFFHNAQFAYPFIPTPQPSGRGSLARPEKLHVQQGFSCSLPYKPQALTFALF